MIERSPGLLAEIGQLYKALENIELLSASDVLRSLNEPHRVQRRGFEVTARQLLAELICLWRIDDNTRWAIYDYDMELLGGKVFKDKDACVETIEGYQQADNLMPVRFQHQ
jgi:hypothetical protein